MTDPIKLDDLIEQLQKMRNEIRNNVEITLQVIEPYDDDPQTNEAPLTGITLRLNNDGHLELVLS